MNILPRQPFSPAMPAGNPWPTAAPAGSAQTAQTVPYFQPVYVNPLQSIGVSVLLIFIFLLFGRLAEHFLTPLHLPMVFSLLALAFTIANGTFLQVFRNPVGFLLLAFTAWMVIGIPFAAYRAGAYGTFMELWSKSFSSYIIVAGLLTSSIHCARGIVFMAYAFFVAMVLAFRYGSFYDGRYRMEFGIYSGSNELAAAMVLGCLYWLFIVESPVYGKLRRFIGLIAIPLMLIILLRTGSRAGVLGLGLLFIILFFRYSAMTKIVLVLVGALVFMLAITFLPATLLIRYSTFFTSDVEEGASYADSERAAEASMSAQGRRELMLKSLRYTLQNPIFGIGAGNFAVVENNEAVANGKRKGFWQGTHNTYTQISSETGIVGFLFMFGAMMYCWKFLRGWEKQLARIPSAGAQHALKIAFFLRLTLIYYLFFFCFEHIAYGPFLPTLFGMVVGFHNAALREVVTQAPDGSRAGPPSPNPSSQLPPNWSPASPSFPRPAYGR